MIALVVLTAFSHSKSAKHKPLYHRTAVHKRHHVANPFAGWHVARILVTVYVIDPPDPGVCRRNGYEYFAHSLTATGSHPGPGTIAVDTRIFPFGTRFYIPGYGYGVGRDRGGAINGYHIDAAVMSCQAAVDWATGRRAVHYR